MSKRLLKTPVRWDAALMGMVGVIGLLPGHVAGATTTQPGGGNEGASAADLKQTPISPTPEQLAHATTLSRMGALRASLMQSHPATFGGLYSTDGVSTFRILYVASSASQADVATDVEAAAVSFLRSASPADTSLTPLEFGQVAVSLADLYKLKDQVVNDFGSWGSTGYPVYGAGIDDKTNSVQVTVPEGADIGSYRIAFENAYKSTSFEFVEGDKPTLTLSRTADAAPWWGGDEIVLGTGPSKGDWCTTGFPAHDASHNTYILTAGHCSSGNTGANWKFYNTTYQHPDYSSGRFVGQPDAQAFTSKYDVERIPTSTNGYFWQGVSNSEPISNDATPTVGNDVCLEGSISYESCAPISVVDEDEVFDVGVLHGIFATPNAAPVGGDSGGPVVWPTVYGYIAQGGITGFGHEGGTMVGYSTGINFYEYLLGVTVTSIAKP
jgi:hypothetical protein